MRILQVVHDFVPETMAGTEINTHKLAVDLHVRYGHDVHVLCRGWDLECEPYRERNEELDGLHVRRIDFGRGGLPNYWQRHDARLEAAFRRALDEIQPDLVHIQHFIYLSIDLVAIAKAAGIPVVVTLHDFWFRCPWGTLLYHDDSLCHRRPGIDCLSCLWPDRLSRRRHVIPWRQFNPLQIAAYKRLGASAPLPNEVSAMLGSLDTWEEEFRSALLQSDMLHSPSEFLKQQLVDFGIPPEHVAVVTNGFQYSREQVRPKRQASTLRLTMIGMHRLKGLHLMIDAFRRLPSGSATLRVYGQVASRRYADEQLARAAGYAVEFCGTYRQDELYDVFGATDVLVVPSIWYENCPTVIREAFATGTPVVAADIGGMAEAVHDGVNGLLFRANDSLSLSRTLERLIAQRGLVDELRTNIVAPLTVEQCTDQIVSLYQTVTAVSA